MHQSQLTAEEVVASPSIPLGQAHLSDRRVFYVVSQNLGNGVLILIASNQMALPGLTYTYGQPTTIYRTDDASTKAQLKAYFKLLTDACRITDNPEDAKSVRELQERILGWVDFFRPEAEPPAATMLTDQSDAATHRIPTPDAVREVTAAVRDWGCGYVPPQFRKKRSPIPEIPSDLGPEERARAVTRVLRILEQKMTYFNAQNYAQTLGQDLQNLIQPQALTD